jgi:formimidoylglutamate deiminase
VIYSLYYYGDFDIQASDLQLRFCDKSLDDSCDHFDALVQRFIDMGDYRIAWAIAAHSLRAVSLDQIVGLKTRLTHMPFHMHVSEQRREVDACVRKYGMGPVELLASRKVLDSCTTLVHATHLREGEVDLIEKSGALVCMCPSTEADLGDGLGHAAELFHAGVSMCLGTDGQTHSSIMAEARRMEMHERLRSEQRNVFVKSESQFAATELFKAATQYGATALGVETGMLRQGKWADLVAYDLNDPSLAGADNHTLLSSLLFSSDSKAVRDVMVGGKWVVQDGIHPKARESSRAFTQMSHAMFSPEEGA